MSFSVKCRKCGKSYPSYEIGDHEETCPKKAAVKKIPDAPALPEQLTKTGQISTMPKLGYDLVPGKPCPACGKQYGLGAAGRQRRYRERKDG